MIESHVVIWFDYKNIRFGSIWFDLDLIWIDRDLIIIFRKIRLPCVFSSGTFRISELNIWVKLWLYWFQIWVKIIRDLGGGVIWIFIYDLVQRFKCSCLQICDFARRFDLRYFAHHCRTHTGEVRHRSQSVK